ERGSEPGGGAARGPRTESDSMPAELDEITRRILQLEIEREALRKETDPASRERLTKLEKDLTELQDHARTLRAQWESEKGAIEKPRQLRQRIEDTKVDVKRAMRAGDLARAAELQYGTLVQLARWPKDVAAQTHDTGRGGLIR